VPVLGCGGAGAVSCVLACVVVKEKEKKKKAEATRANDDEFVTLLLWIDRPPTLDCFA
jgi:hypothetical protein